MMHKAWSSIEEVPYCFSRSSIKFQGHIALEIVEFDSNWAFPDCNSSLNSTMAMKCCTKLETAKKRCPIVFQGHPSNFKVTRDKHHRFWPKLGVSDYRPVAAFKSLRFALFNLQRYLKHLKTRVRFHQPFWKIMSDLGNFIWNWPDLQMPQCTSPTSHIAPFCNRNVHICVTKWYIVG